MYYNLNELREYTKPISEYEKQQCINAIDMVKDALVAYGYTIDSSRNNFTTDGYAYFYEFKSSDSGKIIVLIQGSYANNTSIKRYSDVDVAIVCNLKESEFPEIYFAYYKEDIYRALRDKFGSCVNRKNKSIKVEGNTYRKSIDVVPAMCIRNNIDEGIKLMTDKGNTIFNFPLQQINNENQKNRCTNYNFKKYVRVFKNIRMDMISSGIVSAKSIGSFQIESLIWNIPDTYFNKYDSICVGIDDTVNYLVSKKYSLDSYYESNGIKQLCNNSTDRANLGQFIDDLRNFYGYII